jgi:hypothetical protein
LLSVPILRVGLRNDSDERRCPGELASTSGGLGDEQEAMRYRSFGELVHDQDERGETNMTDGIATEIEKLASLRDRGLLTEDEFQTQKAAVLGTPGVPSTPTSPPATISWSTTPPPAPEERRRHPVRILLVAVLLVMVVGGGGAAYALTRPAGTKTVTFGFTDYNGGCTYAEDTDGLSDGTPVTVTGDNGAHIATGDLNNSFIGQATLSDGSTIPDCNFVSHFTVPNNQNSYTFNVEGQDGGITYTRSQLENEQWMAGIQLGCPPNLQGGC